jgi:hypothetical protein
VCAADLRAATQRSIGEFLCSYFFVLRRLEKAGEGVAHSGKLFAEYLHPT